MVYNLNKALYGLKQALRPWYKRIDEYFLRNGFKRSLCEPIIYTKNFEDDFLCLCLYVDDIVYTGSSRLLLDEFKKSMEKKLEMTNLGELKYFLGIEVEQFSHGIFVNQKKYALELLKKFQMGECKPVSTPMSTCDKLKMDDSSGEANEHLVRSLVGGLLFISNTLPDIVLVTNLVSRFMHKPIKQHWIMGKRILRYVQGTIDYGILYKNNEDTGLVSYSNSD